MIEAAQEPIVTIYLPLFLEGEAQAEKIKFLFTDFLPKYLAKLEPYVSKGEFIAGNKLSSADFVVGGLYVNYFVNKDCPFAAEEFAKILEEFPNFKAYGERFVAANKSYLETRIRCPI